MEQLLPWKNRTRPAKKRPITALQPVDVVTRDLVGDGLIYGLNQPMAIRCRPEAPIYIETSDGKIVKAKAA